MAIKLVAIDTDGTLLNSAGQILASTKAAITKALNQGVKIVLCSGRPIAGLKPYMTELGITGPKQYAVTLNGAITRDADDKIITKDLVGNELYRKMTAFALAHKLPFNVVDEDSHIITANHNIDYVVYLQAYENTAPLYVRTPDELPNNFSVAKGCFVGESELLDRYQDSISAEFGKELYVIRSDPHFIELLNPKVNKGNGLKELCATLNIDASEVMALGDERNDIPMFNFAGTGVCMGNGSQQAKEQADYITSSNNDNGISQAFTKFVF
ncbi:Cof-type HAD-IIB family hydrolase [Lactobacillus sp. ESL0679]|uniref:Cof-type HAD-IIB family hydrolase n=1 Tax=Lactobacillus sp. ESL0679 TaxID=2983209 RepID=UPI0023F9D452|nr:Cof-type HAD-IIB family hydrolase [Lactobacillus sp. ESL0679]MDF7683594.1 Cof-type HAD-IIB family hydrolase [Lactobacillus sp. ESL0679]